LGARCLPHWVTTSGSRPILGHRSSQRSGHCWAPRLQPHGLASRTSIALLVASGGLEPSVMPLLGGPRSACGGVEQLNEGSGDRQRTAKKNGMDTREGKEDIAGNALAGTAPLAPC
jgi:hypothetical protein